jgi:type III secretory pathway component EscT
MRQAFVNELTHLGTIFSMPFIKTYRLLMVFMLFGGLRQLIKVNFSSQKFWNILRAYEDQSLGHLEL